MRVLEQEVDSLGSDSRDDEEQKGGEEVEVDTYVWVAGENGLEEGEWDFEEFMREKMGRWVLGNEEYDGESLRFPVLEPFITTKRAFRKRASNVH